MSKQLHLQTGPNHNYNSNKLSQVRLFKLGLTEQQTGIMFQVTSMKPKPKISASYKSLSSWQMLCRPRTVSLDVMSYGARRVQWLSNCAGFNLLCSTDVIQLLVHVT